MPQLELHPEQFAKYPPEARKLAVRYAQTLQRLPLSFLPSLLRELIDYDFRFPAERAAIEKELGFLSALSGDQAAECFAGFTRISLSPQLEHMDWVNAPGQFVEQLSAYLWTTRQLDAFREAATAYGSRLRAAAPAPPPEMPRLGITVIGQGVTTENDSLFRKLRPHGAYFTNVKPEHGLETLLAAVAARAMAKPAPYAHWYIDGGAPVPCNPGLSCVSYRALQPARGALSSRLRTEIEKPGMGPEALRTLMAEMRPRDLGLGGTNDTALDWFQLKVLTEGSGTQIFSTTFAQWAAREALRRAQPLTLLVRFAPRQRQKPMNEMLASAGEQPELDIAGSLMDADMGAFYNYLNQQRLTGAEQSSFLVWFEDHKQAVAIGPAMPRGTTSSASATLAEILSWMA